MTFHVLTIFPEFFGSPFEFGVLARARRKGLLRTRVWDLRNWSFDRHRTVDDRPFGGGEGMVLKAEPVFLAAEEIFPRRDPRKQRIVLMSAQGARFDQTAAARLGTYEEILLICGRYEGVDERVSQFLADEELSIGDYVLSGGELAAAVVVDAVSRLIPGVLGNEESARQESFASEAMLDYPHYTRPAVFRGWSVPDTLLGGNHEEIRLWRRSAARDKTLRLRPDLLERK